MSETLHVWYENYLAGTLKQVERGDVVFQYSAQWLAYPDRFAVSLSLPLQESAFSRELSTAFFDNYLPEEHLRAIHCLKFLALNAPARCQFFLLMKRIKNTLRNIKNLYLKIL